MISHTVVSGPLNVVKGLKRTNLNVRTGRSCHLTTSKIYLGRHYSRHKVVPLSAGGFNKEKDVTTALSTTEKGKKNCILCTPAG
jgi:hypothetical protein